MSGVKISALPTAAVVSATDQVEVNQSGTTRRLTLGQVAATTAVYDALRFWGAKGDGVTDDTAAFQAAVNAAANNLLYVSPGTYLVSSVSLPGTITIVGSGDASVIKTVSDAFALSYEGTGPGVGGNGIHIRSLKFLGNSGPGLTQQGIAIRGARNVSIIDCTFQDIGARALSVTYSHDNSFVAKHIQVIGNRIINTGDTAIFLKTAVEECVVTGNTIEDVGITGAQPGVTFGIVVDDASGSQLPIASSNVVVANNVIKNLQGDDTARAILVSGGENIAITNNVLTDIGSTGPLGCIGIRVVRGTGTPFITSKRVLVSSNLLTNIGHTGISLLAAERCNVIGNSITNWGCNANPAFTLNAAVMLETACINNVVSGNVMVGGATSHVGINVFGADNIDNMVWGNFITANGHDIEDVHDLGTTTLLVFNQQGQLSKTNPGVTLLMHSSTGPTALATSGTQFVVAQGVMAANATNTNVFVAFIDNAIKVRRWRVVLSVAPGAGTSRIFTLQRASVDTAVTVTISDTATAATFSGDVTISGGNYIAVKSTVSGTPAASFATFVMEYSV